MEMDLLEASVKYMAKFIKSVIRDQDVLLTIDGHSSKNVVEW